MDYIVNYLRTNEFGIFRYGTVKFGYNLYYKSEQGIHLIQKRPKWFNIVDNLRELMNCDIEEFNELLEEALNPQPEKRVIVRERKR